MKRKGVAAALSALVFPGAGQYYLGRKTRALAFAVVAAAAGTVYLNYQVNQAASLAGPIADQILSGKSAVDPAALEAQLEALPTPFYVTVAGIVFLASWIGSLLEIYLARPAR